MATSQQFDALDGLVITGKLDVGGNVAIDTNVLYVDAENNRVGINKVPTTAFDVNGLATFTSVDINGGSVDGLTQLSVDNLTLNGTTVSSTSGITLDAVGDIALNADGADILLQDASVQFGALTNTSGNLIIKSGTTTAMTFSGANITLAGNTTIADNNKIDFGSVMDITATSSGASLSANTYHGGAIVSSGDINTYIQFNAADTFRVVTGGSQRLLANNSGAYISGILDVSTDITARRVKTEDVFIETTNTPAALVFDLNSGSAFEKSNAGAGGTVSFTMPSPAVTGAFGWSIKFLNSGNITWPAAVKWSEGVEPPHSTGTDIYTFITYDGGTTIYGSLSIRNAS